MPFNRGHNWLFTCALNFGIKKRIRQPYQDGYFNEVTPFRESQQMRKVKKGLRLCLGCDKKFESRDLLVNRLCECCSRRQEYDR